MVSESRGRLGKTEGSVGVGVWDRCQWYGVLSSFRQTLLKQARANKKQRREQKAADKQAVWQKKNLHKRSAVFSSAHPPPTHCPPHHWVPALLHHCCLDSPASTAGPASPLTFRAVRDLRGVAWLDRNVLLFWVGGGLVHYIVTDVYDLLVELTVTSKQKFKKS